MFWKNSSSSWNWGKGLARKALSFVFEIGALINAMPARPGSLAEKELLIILIGEPSNFHLVRHSAFFLNLPGVPWGSKTKQTATDSQPVLPDGEIEDLQPGTAEDEMDHALMASQVFHSWQACRWKCLEDEDQSDVAPMEKLHGDVQSSFVPKSVGQEKHMSRFKWCLGCWHFTRNLKILRTDSQGWDVRVIRWPSLRRYNRRMMISLNPWRVLQVWELQIVKGIIQQLNHQLKTCWSKQRTRCLP